MRGIGDQLALGLGEDRRVGACGLEGAEDPEGREHHHARGGGALNRLVGERIEGAVGQHVGASVERRSIAGIAVGMHEDAQVVAVGGLDGRSEHRRRDRRERCSLYASSIVAILMTSTPAAASQSTVRIAVATSGSSTTTSS